MALVTLQELFDQIRHAPLAWLTSRTLKSLIHYLSGRDLALAHLGAPGWSDLPIAERVERTYQAKTMPWRHWTDIVESFARDEWAAFDDFLALTATWSDPMPATAEVGQPSMTVPAVIESIGACPEMYLGERSVFRLADFLRGYLDTLASALSPPPRDFSEVNAFLEDLPSYFEDSRGRSWFKVLRFHATNDVEAFDAFFCAWRARWSRR